jgi:cystathionine beta-lyase/cystathionine gamma-synthase
VEHVEKKIALLEGAQSSLLTTTGMSALSLLFLTFLKSGDHGIVVGDHYIGIRLLLNHLQRFHIRYTLVPPDPQEILSAIREETVFFFTELPTNPHLYVYEFEPLFEELKKRGILIVVDSTLATPYLFSPLRYGADLVIHSGTKYLGGHNDLLAGVISGNQERISALREVLGPILGAVLSPFSAFLLDRGLKTLHLRVPRVSETARFLIERLKNHPRVEKIYYPEEKWVERYMKGMGGGVFSFVLKGGEKDPLLFLDNLKIARHAVSLGGTETLISIPYYFVHSMIGEKGEFLPSPNLIRVSVGLEDPQDLWDEFCSALEKLPP